MCGDEILDGLFNHSVEIYESGELPTDFKKSVVAIIPMKNGSEECYQ